MKKFCKCLKKYARRINNFLKKEMKLLTSEQQELDEKAKICYICWEKFEDKYANAKNIAKLEIIAIILMNIEVLHIENVI